MLLFEFGLDHADLTLKSLSFQNAAIKLGADHLNPLFDNVLGHRAVD
jgi:hypothetical protein